MSLWCLRCSIQEMEEWYMPEEMTAVITGTQHMEKNFLVLASADKFAAVCAAAQTCR